MHFSSTGRETLRSGKKCEVCDDKDANDLERTKLSTESFEVFRFLIFGSFVFVFLKHLLKFREITAKKVLVIDLRYLKNGKTERRIRL